MKEKEFLEILHQASRATGFSSTGDDAACVHPSNVLSTDQFIEGTHFEWHHMTARQLGHKAVVQALSDLAAMGATPTAVLTSLAWGPDHAIHISEFIKGLETACIRYKVPLVGGDISVSRALFYADVTVAGTTTAPILKKGARPGHILALTGTVGDAGAGLEIVRQGLPMQNDFSRLVERYRSPQAQLEVIARLRAVLPVHAATDISDSLSKSILQIAEHSSVGVEIDGETIPISEELRAYAQAVGRDVYHYAWNAGEDYQLLIALPESTPESVFRDHGLTAIGRVTNGSERRVCHGDQTAPLTEVGWDPFAL